MKVLIIGYGSISARHHCLLKERFSDISGIDIVSKHLKKHANAKIFKNIEEIKNINNYDYFLICSETSAHYKQLSYLDSVLKNKKIFIEKPVFEKSYFFRPKNNRVFVGYNLRFHKILSDFKKLLLEDDSILSAHIIVGQYLPTWRPNRDYRKTYSAFKNQGGGVLLDLSHEIDYMKWLFGNIENVFFFHDKISNLEIDSRDFFTCIAKTERGIYINLFMDYINKIKTREVMVNTLKKSYKLDLVNNNMKIIDQNRKEINYNYEDLSIDDSYCLMHDDILNNNAKKVCSFDEAVSIIEFIEKVS